MIVLYRIRDVADRHPLLALSIVAGLSVAASLLQLAALWMG